MLPTQHNEKKKNFHTCIPNSNKRYQLGAVEVLRKINFVHIFLVRIKGRRVLTGAQNFTVRRTFHWEISINVEYEFYSIYKQLLNRVIQISRLILQNNQY